MQTRVLNSINEPVETMEDEKLKKLCSCGSGEFSGNRLMLTGELEAGVGEAIAGLTDSDAVTWEWTDAHKKCQISRAEPLDMK